MSFGAIILLAAQAASGAQSADVSQPFAVRATASVEILTATTLSFNDWGALAEKEPSAVQLRTDAQGTVWVEFS